MTTELHKCRDCDRQIPVHVPCCIYCKSKYTKAGICWWCGELPVKPRSKNGQQSVYCAGCQQLKKGLLESEFPGRTLSWKGTEYKGRKLLSPQRSSHLPNDREVDG